ncbi:acetyl-CoA C-acyltransferase [Pseudoteredinibacter isoporae]|uniref:acetyl-CoA C-acyltransferase n=1 Tax=Pseudoteredinibacter isoporae TaxID=570281 RepID=UPI00310570D7
MNTFDDVYIYETLRSPRTKAKAGTGLSGLSSIEVMLPLFNELEARAPGSKKICGDLILGSATQTGEQGANVAKLAANTAGWTQLPAMTINRYCTSALDAMAIAAGKISLGIDQAVLAGGVEMMSRTPMMSDKAPGFMDPKVATAAHNLPLGIGADLIASLQSISRGDADRYALRSQERASRAISEGRFKRSVVGISTEHGLMETDNAPRSGGSLESLAELSASFAKMGAMGIDQALLAQFKELSEINHIHHPGNSPGMVDGASLNLMGNKSIADDLGVSARGRVLGFANACGDPRLVLTGGIDAADKLLAAQKMTMKDVDLMEFNESFAATSIYCQRHFDLDDEQYNVNGGALSLGHPMGATGAMLVGMALDELERQDKSLALIAVSGAIGIGTAMLVERV